MRFSVMFLTKVCFSSKQIVSLNSLEHESKKKQLEKLINFKAFNFPVQQTRYQRCIQQLEALVLTFFVVSRFIGSLNETETCKFFWSDWRFQIIEALVYKVVNQLINQTLALGLIKFFFSACKSNELPLPFQLELI